MAELERCRACNRVIRMLLTGGNYPNGTAKRMPVDPDPTGRSEIVNDLIGRPSHNLVVGTGNIRMLAGGLEIRVLKKDELHEGDLYTSHFATCPQARAFYTEDGRAALQRETKEIRERLQGER